jgi:single-strand DNA-binding protein
MASDINRVVLIGRLTKDPELRYTQNGTAVCSFSIANNRTYVTGGDKREQVSFFNCVAWTKMGEVIAEYCKKGQRIAIEGRLQERKYDAQDGSKKSIVEVVIDNFQFLTPKDREGDAPSSPMMPEPPADHGSPFADDEIPF